MNKVELSEMYQENALINIFGRSFSHMCENPEPDPKNKK